jgi:Tol biopolymer transport system component
LSWAPDGSRLAFASEGEVFTLTPGQTPVVLAQIPGAQGGLSWSRDGTLLALRIGRPATADPQYATSDIVVIDAATGETRFTLVSAGNLEASWSPTGPVLLFDGNACRFEDWQLMLVNGDGTNLHPLTERHDGSLIAGSDWSPDGRRVATRSVESNGAVTTVDVETGETQSVFRSPGILVDLEWITQDRLMVSTTSGTDACNQDLGETTRVVLP